MLEKCVATPKWKWRFPQSRELLLVHDFDLLVDYLTGETVDGNMDPVMLFPFYDEIVLEVLCVRFVMSGLCNNVDQYIPDARLRDRRNRARNNFTSSLNSLVVG